MNKFYLSAETMQQVDQAMANLSANGVAIAEDRSGEMNFSGCATGSGMAWD